MSTENMLEDISFCSRHSLRSYLFTAQVPCRRGWCVYNKPRMVGMKVLEERSVRQVAWIMDAKLFMLTIGGCTKLRNGNYFDYHKLHGKQLQKSMDGFLKHTRKVANFKELQIFNTNIQKRKELRY